MNFHEVGMMSVWNAIEDLADTLPPEIAEFKKLFTVEQSYSDKDVYRLYAFHHHGYVVGNDEDSHFHLRHEDWQVVLHVDGGESWTTVTGDEAESLIAITRLLEELQFFSKDATAMRSYGEAWGKIMDQ